MALRLSRRKPKYVLRRAGFNAKLRGGQPERAANRRVKFQSTPANGIETQDSEKLDLDISRNSDARLIEKRVQSMAEDQVLVRYHALIDKRLIGDLNYKEVFELELVEARLNAADEPELRRVKALENIWMSEKMALVKSIEELLSKLAAR